MQSEGDRVSREGSSRCRIKNFRDPTRLHYAAGFTPSMLLAERISIRDQLFRICLMCYGNANSLINIRFVVDRFFSLFITE